MKTKTILFLFLLFSAVVSAQVKRVAILETVDKEDEVSYATKLILRTSLSKAISNTPGCEVYDRTDIDAIMSEHTFQRTGLVSNDQIKRLGEMTGAEYILVAEAVKINAKKLFVTAKLLDVETARTIVTEMMEINLDHVQQGCAALAKKMFPDDKKLDFSAQTPIEVLLVRNSKADQKLFGLGTYSYGETQMDQKALAAFIRTNSPEVYKRYMRGQKCIKAGWSMFSIGLVATAIGSAAMIIDSKYYTMYEQFDDALDLCDEYDIERREYLSKGCSFYSEQWKRNGYELTGIVLIGFGAGVLTTVSIPLLSCGYGMRNNIHKKYNEQAKEQPKFTLNLQCSQNGMGFALNF